MQYKTGLFAYALAFLLGVVLVQQLTVLPDIVGLILLWIVFSGLYLFLHRYRVSPGWTKYHLHFTLILLFIYLIILGIIYSVVYAKQQLNYRLDESYIGKNIVVSGWVSSIPVTSGHVQRLELTVDSYRDLAQTGNVVSLSSNAFPKKLRLSWYYGSGVNAGEKWQLEVRLKPPHGFMNPGSFDYEGWLFQQGIHATGYVRQSALNHRLQAASSWSINRLRQSLRKQIDAMTKLQQGNHVSEDFSSASALVKALAIGDKSSISTQQWRVLTNTGTSHLMAISGLHIGLAALFAYVLIRRTLPVFIMKRIPAQHVALTGGMLIALLYALIAGLSIPTQRAIIMLFVLALMMLIRRNTRPVDSLGLAMVFILLLDPTAILSAGFWFSFSAVAVIYISLITTDNQNTVNVSYLARVYLTLKQWMKLQLMISVFLLPLSVFMFQQGSLISPVANFILIPYVSFLVVPVILLAIVCSFLFQGVAEALFNLATILLDFIWPLLSTLSALPYAFWVKGDTDIIELLLVIAALLLIYFSRDLSRYIVVKVFSKQEASSHKTVYGSLLLMESMLFIPLFVPNRSMLSAEEYQVTILDVGQGSAAVIQTQNHVAVFDAGARFSDKMDAGSNVVIPYLRSQGIRELDRIIISHGDLDHIGGAQAVIDSFPEADVVGQDIENLIITKSDVNAKQRCIDGIKWHWDGVDFEFISPAITTTALNHSEKRNNRSCVLRISSDMGSVLFTGDIEKKVEQQLLKKYAKQLQVDILIVPHHGSNTSSNQAFVDAINPKISIVSVGYKNRYKLPANRVLARYEAIDSELIQTDSSGAITVQLLSDDVISIERYREKSRKYWHHKLN